MDKTITAITVQKKHTDRFAIYLDGVFAFGLAKKFAENLAVGQSLSENTVTQLRKKDELEAACKTLDHFIGYRERSETEVYKRLIKGGYQEETIRSAINRFKEMGLLNDLHFARNWVNDRIILKPRGRRLLKLELQQKGITPEGVEEALRDIAPDEELAHAAARSHSRRLEKLDQRTFTERLRSFLLRKGFSFDTATDAAQRTWLDIHPIEDGSE
jgi:regulatory protein